MAETPSLTASFDDPRVDVNAKDKSGWTPLHAAAYGGHTSAVRLLLSDPRVDVRATNEASLRKIIPLGDRVLVKRIIAETRSAGGILLADTGKKLNEGEVVSVGPGAVSRDGKIIPVNVKAGDRVLLPEYGGHAVKIGDDEFSLYRDEDILGKIELK